MEKKKLDQVGYTLKEIYGPILFFFDVGNHFFYFSKSYQILLALIANQALFGTDTNE